MSGSVSALKIINNIGDRKSGTEIVVTGSLQHDYRSKERKMRNWCGNNYFECYSSYNVITGTKLLMWEKGNK